MNDPMNRFKLLGATLFLLALLFRPTVGWAGEVVCPVCGQVFPSKTKTCPDDGTDLKLLGNPAEDDSSDDTDSEDGEEEKGDPSPSKPSGYKRHDRGGDRKRTSTSESGYSYSDRDSRIKARRGRVSAEERTQREMEERRRAFLKEEQRLLDDFERQRTGAWEERHLIRHEQIRAAEGRLAAREHLLNGLGAPLTSLGYRMFWMGEGNDSGAVNAAEIDVNLARYRLRAGLSTLIGMRFLSGRSDLVFLEHISVGFQWPARFSPFALVRGGVGILASERFGADLMYLMTSFGVEAGIDSWITPWIAVTPSMGYERIMVESAYWNSFTFKISLGF